MTRALLRLAGIAVEIGGMRILTDVSFDVGAAGCLGLVGETGSGKSMTCRLIAGLLARKGGRVVAGTATFDGIDLVGLNEPGWRALRGRRIALVPQTSLSSLDPVMRVGRQLEEAVRTFEPGAAAAQRSLELLAQVHMPRAREVMRLYPHEMSGGMRQRVMIALALTGRPELLLADEPTTALDVTVQRSILNLLRELRESSGMSMILVTHDLGVVQEVAESVTVMYAGRVVETGPASAVLDHPRHPYTRALLGSRPVGLVSHPVLSAIPGTPPGAAERPSGCVFHPRCQLWRGREECAEIVPALHGSGGAQQLAACHFTEEMSA